MKEWTREERYRSIYEASNEELSILENQVNKCPYRQKFHIQPKTGLLNDPNGFAFYNGQYHLFYQWFPLGPVHGLKHWYHVSSEDLVNWEDCGVAIVPNKYYDSHGAFSGSGFVNNDKLQLFYTGNVRDDKWIRNSYQCVATMDNNNNIIKSDKPFIDGIPKGYTEHFRDPKVFEDNNKYYCIIGAQREKDNYGTIIYYESVDLENWTMKGEIVNDFIGNGFMWECPDYISFDDEAVLIFCPQGIKEQGDLYRNIYQSGYMIGNPIDFSKGIFEHGEFMELDRGFDFYAPQTTVDKDGRRILVGWMGLPEIEYPNDENGWANCLTIPREITLKDHKLIQNPVNELKSLRGDRIKHSFNINNEEVAIDDFSEKTYEAIYSFKDISSDKVGVKFRKGYNEEIVFYYDKKEKKLVLDRSKMNRVFAEEYGTVRKCNFNEESFKIQMFVDTSSIEIFVNDGQEVFTSRIFSDDNSNSISIFADGETKIDVSLWPIIL